MSTSPAAAQPAYYTAEDIVNYCLYYLTNGQLQEAAQWFSSCQEDIGYMLISRASTEKALMQRVAKMFAMAKDFAKAAYCCEQMEDWANAARLYERCGDFQMAGEMFSKVQDFANAAAMFEKCQNFKQAATLYLHVKDYLNAAINLERIKEHFQAGKLYYGLKRYQKAMELLQRLEENDPNFLEASRMTAEILALSGSVDLAIRKLQGVVEERGMHRETADIWYILGILLRKQEQFAEAAEIFEKLVTFDTNYKDAGSRLQEARQHIKSRPPVAAPFVAPEKPAAPAGAHAAISAAAHPGDAGQVDATIKMPSITAKASSAKGQSIVGLMSGFEELKAISFFSELSLPELRNIHRVCVTVNASPGQVLIEQGMEGKSLFIVVKGGIEVRRKGEDGHEAVLARLGPGAHVGEMSLLDDAPTSARVIASEECELLEIGKEQFHNLLNSSDAIAHKVYRVFVKSQLDRLRETNKKLGTMEAQLKQAGIAPIRPQSAEQAKAPAPPAPPKPRMPPPPPRPVSSVRNPAAPQAPAASMPETNSGGEFPW